MKRNKNLFDMNRFATKFANDKGQMTVELCVIFPVVIVIAAIIFNALVFFGDCAEFDRLARNSTRVFASSYTVGESIDSMSSNIQSSISSSFPNREFSCTTSGSIKGGGTLRVEATYEYEPTLFGLPLRASIFGVSLPRISHQISLTLDPYSPGKWLSTVL